MRLEKWGENSEGGIRGWLRERGRIENLESLGDRVRWGEGKNTATSEMGKLALLNKWQFNKGVKNQQQ